MIGLLLIALAVGARSAIDMDAFHIAHVEIGPSPIQAESKFSQIGPSPRKDNPRKRLGFPWISLSGLSLFKDLRGPPGPEISLAPLSASASTELQWRIAPRALAMRRSSLAPGRPIWLRSFIASHYSDEFEFWQAFFRKSNRILEMRTTSTAVTALAAGCDGAAPFGPTANAISARGSVFDAPGFGRLWMGAPEFADAAEPRALREEAGDGRPCWRAW